MKNNRTKVLLGVAAVQIVAIGALSLTGCKSQEVLKDRPFIPAPSETPSASTNISNLPPTPAIPEIKTESLKYTVKSGDSFWKIAKQYGVSKEELAAYNNMSLQKPLKTGTKLMIPPGGAPVTVSHEKSSSKAAGAKGAAPADGNYTVANGDSIWKIAAKYNIKTDALVAANNIDPKKPLQVGQKLVIPEAGAASAKSAKGAAPVAAHHGKEPAPAAADKTAAPAGVPAEPAKSAKPAGPSEEELLLNELEGKSSGATGMTSGTTAAAAAPAPVADAAFDTYEVQEGDTVEDVAAMHGVRADDVRKANPGLPADGKLSPPKTLKIPSSR